MLRAGCSWVALSMLGACFSADQPSDREPVGVVAGVETDLLETDEVSARFTVEGATFGADNGRLSVAVERGRMIATAYDAEDSLPSQLGLETIGITSGDLALEVAPLGSAVDDGGDLLVDRGLTVERVRMKSSGVWQSWEFERSPGEGDLVVRVAVSGASFAYRSINGLHFEGDVGFVYSNARWIDATGLGFDLPAEWIDGAIELRVPADLVDRSVFPAILDPTLDAERGVDAALSNVPTGAAAKFADIAFSGAQYLAVWADARNGNLDIYGARLSTTGAVQDALAIPIATGITTQTKPTVAFANGQYLVAWEDRSGGSSDIRAARVSTLGVVTAIAAPAVTPTLDERPYLIARGNEALLVYESDDDIRAALFSGAAFGASFAVAATANREREPVVAADPAGNYLVAWSDGTLGPDIHGQLVAPAGTLVGAPFVISAGQDAQSEPAAGFAGGNFVVAWSNRRTAIFATRVTTAAAVLDTHLEAALPVGGLSIITGGGPRFPSLACTTSRCAIAWQNRASATGLDIQGRLFNPDLTPFAAQVSLVALAYDQRLPAVTVAGTSFGVIWHDPRMGTAEAVYAGRISAAGALQDPAGILVARGNNGERTPAVGRARGSWLVVWGDSRVVGGNIMGVRISNTGSPVDNAAFNVSSATDQQGTPTVGASTPNNDANYLVAWSDARSGSNRDIYASRVGHDGTVVDPNGIAVSTTAGEQLLPKITSDGSSRYLVVWQELRAGRFDIYGALVSHAGVVIATDLPISTAARDQLAPSAAYDSASNTFVVVWADGRAGSGNGDIYGARVSTSGTVLDPNGVLISGAAGSEGNPDITEGAGRMLVVWEDRRNGLSDIYGARVRLTPTITVDDPAGVALAVALNKQTKPSVAFVTRNEDAFAVIWTDERNLALGNQRDIYGGLYQETTLADLSGPYAIAATSDDETEGAICRGRIRRGDNVREVEVVWQRLMASLATIRTRARRITYSEL